MRHHHFARIPAAMLAMAGLAASTEAAQIHVRPVLVELQAPASAATLTLNNRGKGLVTAQVRVFRWTQVNGKDRLTPTRDVVASPPLLRMPANRDNVVRIVRVTKRPVKGEESYRLIVDQIPDKKKKGTGVVFAVRYSIPVFFYEPGASKPKLSWKAAKRGRKIILTAHNSGARHERIAKLKITSTSGKTQLLSRGLAGYVLGKSTRTWSKPARISLRGSVIIKGQGTHGPLKAKVRLR